MRDIKYPASKLRTEPPLWIRRSLLMGRVMTSVPMKNCSCTPSMEKKLKRVGLARNVGVYMFEEALRAPERMSLMKFGQGKVPISTYIYQGLKRESRIVPIIIFRI